MQTVNPSVFSWRKYMRWYIVNREYVSYLRSFDSRVENIDYGNKLKPYLGIVLKINETSYYLPVSSPKEKHLKMKNAMDFYKLQDAEGTLIAVY